MLVKSGGGSLNDWDLAKGGRLAENTLLPQDDPPRNSYRTGTWYFLSARLLMDPLKIHTLQDDLESIFYLVLYYAPRYIPCNKGMEELREVHAQPFLEWRESVIGRALGCIAEFYRYCIDGEEQLFEEHEDEPLPPSSEPVSPPLLLPSASTIMNTFLPCSRRHSRHLVGRPYALTSAMTVNLINTSEPKEPGGCRRRCPVACAPPKRPLF
ncbi:unnamed protein product [Cyclocybe aegerita]|uniref:Fungal-type protein kinase domain-containing protein n=1 Tax=Cyclocybe aegerita TaxID=1973307 RepID=A0A8S0W3T9_CYCAE|nr:unnamed protein product [Cyclocybe aegerita]